LCKIILHNKLCKAPFPGSRKAPARVWSLSTFRRTMSTWTLDLITWPSGVRVRLTRNRFYESTFRPKSFKHKFMVKFVTKFHQKPTYVNLSDSSDNYLELDGDQKPQKLCFFTWFTFCILRLKQFHEIKSGSRFYETVSAIIYR
jgi:hypothetical protein